MNEQYEISKGFVQETLLIPLYGRKMAMDLYPDLFADCSVPWRNWRGVFLPESTPWQAVGLAATVITEMGKVRNAMIEWLKGKAK